MDNQQIKTQTCNRKDFADQAFAYYDFTTEKYLDREPSIKTWDLLFTNYRDESYPFDMKVPGVLTNVVLNRQKNFQPIGVLSSDYSPQSFDEPIPNASQNLSTLINTIGWDWKIPLIEPPFPVHDWVVNDSNLYVIQDISGNLWKFKFLSYQTNGKCIFLKQKIGNSSIFPEELSVNTYLNIYPNPAQKSLYLTLPKVSWHPIILTIYDMQGRVVLKTESDIVQTAIFDISTLVNGVYTVTVRNQNFVYHQKLVVQN